MSAEPNPQSAGAPPGQEKDFGAIAVELGHCTARQVQEAQAILKDVAKLNLAADLPSVLIKLGYLTSEQAAGVERVRSGTPILAGFEILERLELAGLGVLFKARQISMDRLVILKILPRRLAQDPRFKERFLREARLCAQLSHPNLIRAIQCGESGGHVYFATEYAEGRTARQLLLDRGRVPPAECLHMARQIAEALAYVHSRGLVHRDLKPSSILVAPDGHARLCDLGLAGTADERPESGPTPLSGTPHYVSPELAQGQAEIDGRADLYSLGAALYHLLSGRTLFSGTSPAVLMNQHVASVAPALTEVCPGIAQEYGFVVAKLLAKSRADRYADANDLIGDLDALKAGAPCGAMDFRAASSCALPSPGAPSGIRATTATAQRITAGFRGARALAKPSAVTPAAAWTVALLGLAGASALAVMFWPRQTAERPTPLPQTQPAPPEPSHPLPETAKKVEAKAVGPAPEADKKGEPPSGVVSPETPAKVEAKSEPAKTSAVVPDNDEKKEEPAVQPVPTPPSPAPPEVTKVEPPPDEPQAPPPVEAAPPDPGPALHARFLAEVSRRAAKADLARIELDLRGLAKQPEFAPISARTEADLKDIASAARLEQDGLKALGERKGELDLPPDLARTFQMPKARIEGYDPSRGLAVSASGVGLYVSAASLPAAQVAAAAGATGREVAAATLLMLRGAFQEAHALVAQAPEADRERVALRLEYLRAGEREMAAQFAFQEVERLARARQWRLLKDSYEAFVKEYAGTVAVGEHAVELAEWKKSLESESNAPRGVFHAASVKALPDGAIELVYDFAAQAQLADFECSNGTLSAANGAAVLPDGGGDWACLKLRAPVAELRALEVTGQALAWSAHLGVALLAPGQQSAEEAPKCIWRLGGGRLALIGWDPPYVPGPVPKCNAFGTFPLTPSRSVKFAAESDGRNFIWSVGGKSLGQGRLPDQAVGGQLVFFSAQGHSAWSGLRIVFKPEAQWLQAQRSRP